MKHSKTKWIRLTALFLAIFCMASALASCAGDPPEGETPDVPPAAPDPVAIAADGVSSYVIVYGSTDGGGRNAAKRLQSDLQARTGALLELVDDRTAPVEGVPEILVGRTNRGQAYGPQRSLRVGEWAITRENENIYLLGDSEALLKRACEHFINNVMDVDFIVSEYGEIYRVGGRYDVETVTLNGLPITDYTFLYERGNGVNWREILTWAEERLTAVSGYVLTTATDDEAYKGATVELKSDRTLGVANYQIDVAEQSIVIRAGSQATALALLAGLIEQRLPAAARGDVALTLHSKSGNVGDGALVELSAGADVRVMTYNVLGNVEKATDYISATVAAFLPDFLCTQEY